MSRLRPYRRAWSRARRPGCSTLSTGAAGLQGPEIAGVGDGAVIAFRSHSSGGGSHTRVLEVLNDVMRVSTTSGSGVTAPTALNGFLGYAPAINRSTGALGPFVTDPSCLYDAPTGRWFLDVLTPDSFPAGRRRWAAALHGHQPPRSRGEQHLGSGRRLDDLPHPGAGRRHRGHAEPSLLAQHIDGSSAADEPVRLLR